MENKIEFVRLEARQILAEGRIKGFPLALSHLTIQMLMRREGMSIPSDILAFVFSGKISDRDVTDWQSPVGA